MQPIVLSLVNKFGIVVVTLRVSVVIFPAVIAKLFAFLAKLLRMRLAGVNFVIIFIGLLQGFLFVRVNVDPALLALLSHVGPTVAAHPLSAALAALIVPKTAPLPLVWRQSCLAAALVWCQTCLFSAFAWHNCTTVSTGSVYTGVERECSIASTTLSG